MKNEETETTLILSLDTNSENVVEELCPICKEALTISGRCRTCYLCGYSSCDL